MASGTPLLTTRLPGIPDDYAPFVFYFDEESVGGFVNKLKEVLAKTDEELQAFGMNAQAFVLHQKNDIAQAGRILNLIQQ